jgi:MSHA biogenesis protein MshQ
MKPRRSTIGLLLLSALLWASTAAEAQVAYRSSFVPSLSSSNSTSITLTVPTQTATGDVMVAFVSVNSGTEPDLAAPPAGWTVLPLLPLPYGSSAGVGVYYRMATAADVAGTTTYTWNLISSARVGGAILAFSGVSTVAPVVASGSSVNGSSTSYTAPSITPGVTNTMLVSLYTINYGNGSGLSTPSGMSQAFDTSAGAGPNGVEIGGFYGALSAAGATGTRVTTGSSNAVSIGVSLALQPGASGATHFHITTSNYGLYCLSQSVTVTVLDGANNPVPSYSGTITLSTTTGLGTWTLASGGGTFQDPVPNDGLATYTFPGNQSAATFALSYTSGPAVVTVDAKQSSPTVITDDGTQGAITFAPSGFTVTSAPFTNPAGGVPAFASPQVAGNNFSVYLTAYGQTPTDPTCGIIKSYAGPRNLNFWSTYVNPATGTIVPTVNGTAIATSEASSTAQSVTFTSGQATVTANYQDAGSLSLSMKDATTGNPGLPNGIRGSTGTFVSVPANFIVTNIRRTSNGFANPAAGTATGPVFIPAGQPFSATVTAVASGGTTTPNFGRESPMESVKFVTSLVLPSSGADPAVAGTAGTFSNGVATGTTFSWPEVGIVTLVPHVADGDYLGAGDVTGSATGNVGRFVPNGFATALNTPVFGTACSAGNFTYLGQPFTYTVAPVITVTAQALGGTTTQNYTGSLMRLTNGSLTGRTYTPTPSSPSLNLSGLPATSVDPAVADQGSGVVTLTFSAGAGVSFTRGSPVAPFTANIALAQNVIDLDGISAVNPVTFGAGSGIAFSTSATQLYGRLLLRDSLGSELLDLPTSLTIQYYLSAAQGFTTNSGEILFGRSTSDSCSAAPALALSNYQVNLSAGMTCVRDTGNPGVSGIGCSAAATPSYRATASGGDFNLILSAPGAGHNGAVTVTATAPSWLQYLWSVSSGVNSNPTGTASFGLFPGPASRVHQREVY